MTGYVVMAVHRPDPAHLKEQVRSLTAQTLPDWRCLVGIDGDDPTTLALVERECGADGRFTVLQFEYNLGHYRHFERLLRQVPPDAAWVALCDQDDVWGEDKLARITPLLDGASLAQGEASAVSAHGIRRAERRTDRGLSALLVDNQVTGSFAVVSPDVLDVALPFPAPTAAAYHDHWLAVCAHVLEGVTTLHEVVQVYRQHDSNVIGETVPGRLGARLRLLARAADSARPGRLLDEVVRERLAWRVRMARTLLERVDVRPDDRVVLRAFAAGTPGRGLARLVLTDVVLLRVPAARAAALLLAAAWVAATGRR